MSVTWKREQSVHEKRNIHEFVYFCFIFNRFLILGFFFYNLLHNVVQLFRVFGQASFTASKTGLDIYNLGQKIVEKFMNLLGTICVFLWNDFYLAFCDFLEQLSKFAVWIVGRVLNIKFNHFRDFLEIFSDHKSFFFLIGQTGYGDLVNLHIQSEYRKIRTRNNSLFGHFSRCEKPPELASHNLRTW